MRGPLLPPTVPGWRSRAERFDMAVLERALERIEQEKGPLPSQSSILLKLRSACSPSQIANDCILVDVRRSLPPRSVEDERFAEVLIDKDTQQIYEVH